MWNKVVQPLLVTCLLVGAYWLYDSQNPGILEIPRARLANASYEAEIDCNDDFRTHTGARVGRMANTVLLGNDVIVTEVCGPGELRLDLRGTSVRGVGAHVVVALDLTRLWEGWVETESTLTIPVVRDGYLSVGFHNDQRTNTEDRNLSIDGAAFIPSKSGHSYDSYQPH